MEGAIEMLKKEYDYFNANFEELLWNYEGEYIVIKNEAVIGHYSTFEEAYKKTSKTEKTGTFIIQHCVEQNYEQMMHFAWNNVSFEQVAK